MSTIVHVAFLNSKNIPPATLRIIIQSSKNMILPEMTPDKQQSKKKKMQNEPGPNPIF